MLRSRRLRSTTVAALAVVVAGAVAAAGDDGVKWHESWPAAQAAARKSGRAILVYIFLHNQPASVEMDKTLATPEVIAELNTAFEPLAMNISDSRSRAFLEQHGVGRAKTASGTGETVTSRTPAYLFLDAAGKEYHRELGFMAPKVLLAFLRPVKQVISLSDRVTQDSRDALAHADLGHLYLELDRPGLGKPLLEKAIELDPRNEASARQEAELGLTILAMPDDPAAAFTKLMAYRFAHPESPRRFEAQYYMAVAQLAAQHYDQAERLLLDFQDIPPLLPDGKTPNPDYRNHWTTRADILLKDLRDALHPPPKPDKPQP